MVVCHLNRGSWDLSNYLQLGLCFRIRLHDRFGYNILQEEYVPTWFTHQEPLLMCGVVVGGILKLLQGPTERKQCQAQPGATKRIIVMRALEIPPVHP